MKISSLVIIAAQIAISLPLPGQIQLKSDPSTPGESTGLVVVGDFNGDGKLDVVVPNYNGTTLTVKLGLGNGLFQAVSQPAVAGAQEVLTADVNHDGKLDLISISSTGAAVGVSFGNGDGTFQAPVLTTLPFPAGAPVIGDLNGDGIPDLVLASGTNTILPLLGNANGTYTAQPSIIVPGGFGVSGLAVGDFNGDGHGDIVASCNGTHIYFGHGNGTFGAPQTISPITGSVVAADLNKDGHLDLAMLYDFTVTVYLNSGSGTFSQSYSASGNIAGTLTFADVNGDGNLDLLAADVQGEGVYVELGNGNGTFQPTVMEYYGSGGPPHEVVVGDFTGDGIPDILLGGQDAVCVLIALGGGNFLEPSAPVVGGSGFTALATADFNHDGLADVVYFAPSGTNLGRAQVKVALSNGDGTFAPTSEVVAQDFYGTSEVTTAVGDLNHDGNPDIIYASSTMYLVTALSYADGSFQPTVTAAKIPGSLVLGLATADFNGDGNLDIAVLVSGTNSSGSTYVALNIYPGSGNGTVGTPTSIALTPGRGTFPSVVTGDFNGDGHPDLAVMTDNVLIVLTNSGTGTFAVTSRTPLNYAYALAAGDINRDGLTDLVVGGNAPNGLAGLVTLFLSNEDGTFAKSSYVSGAASAIAVTDLNGDGYPEVISENRGSQDASVLENHGGTLSYGGSWYNVSNATQPLLVGHFVNGTALDLLGLDLLAVIGN